MDKDFCDDFVSYVAKANGMKVFVGLGCVILGIRVMRVSEMVGSK